MTTTNPFDSPRQVIDRARDHLREFHKRGKEYFDSEPYKQVLTTDPKTGQQRSELRIVRNLPPSIATVGKDCLTNLRDALDQAVVASAKAVGVKSLRSIYFPFCGSNADFQRELAAKCKNVPPEIVGLISKFQPYKGGDDTLWHLSKLSAVSKHQFVSPVVAIRALDINIGIPWPSDDGSGTWTLTNPDGSIKKGTMPDLLKQMVLGQQVEIVKDIVFGPNVEFWGNLPVIPILRVVGGKVVDIVNAIESECRRAGYIA
jgi:hypothetical protein